MAYFRVDYVNEYCGEESCMFIEAENRADAIHEAELNEESFYPNPEWYLDEQDFETYEEYDETFNNFLEGNRCFVEEIDEEEYYMNVNVEEE